MAQPLIIQSTQASESKELAQADLVNSYTINNVLDYDNLIESIIPASTVYDMFVNNQTQLKKGKNEQTLIKKVETEQLISNFKYELLELCISSIKEMMNNRKSNKKLPINGNSVRTYKNTSCKVHMLLYGRINTKGYSDRYKQLENSIFKEVQTLLSVQGWYLLDESDKDKSNKTFITLYSSKPRYYDITFRLWHGLNKIPSDVRNYCIQCGNCEEGIQFFSNTNTNWICRLCREENRIGR
jgi:hypothetical protein